MCTCQGASRQARLIREGSTTHACKSLAIHVKAEEVHCLQRNLPLNAQVWVRHANEDAETLQPKTG